MDNDFDQRDDDGLNLFERICAVTFVVGALSIATALELDNAGEQDVASEPQNKESIEESSLVNNFMESAKRTLVDFHINLCESATSGPAFPSKAYHQPTSDVYICD